jgi:L-lactate permease
MSYQAPQEDKKYRTRQLFIGVIILAFALTAISILGANVAGPIFANTISYAISLFTLLFLGRMVQAQERMADAVDKLVRREVKNP